MRTYSGEVEPHASQGWYWRVFEEDTNDIDCHKIEVANSGKLVYPPSVAGQESAYADMIEAQRVAPRTDPWPFPLIP